MAPVSLPLTGLSVRVFHLSYNKNMNCENWNNSREDARPFTCLWWHTYQRWRSQNFRASFVPLRINLQVDHPLEWAACILGMKAEGQSDLSYSSGSDNLWERKNGNVELCCPACFTKTPLGVFPDHSHRVQLLCFADPCWCCTQCGRMKSSEKTVLFQGKLLRVEPRQMSVSGLCLRSILHIFSSGIFFFTVTSLSICSRLHFFIRPCLQRSGCKILDLSQPSNLLPFMSLIFTVIFLIP